MATRAAQVAYWIKERESIRMLRSLGAPPPWTSDKILGSYRFCNVHRENDTVTRWIAQHWRNPNWADPFLSRTMTLARLINWPPTLAHIGYPRGWDVEHIVERIRECERKGKAWSSAYIVSTNGRKIEKALYVVRDVAGEVKPINKVTLEASHRQLMMVNGLGSFMAAQIVADLKNTPGHHLAGAVDWWTWAAPGPGTYTGRSSLLRRQEIAKPRLLTNLEVIAYEVGPPLPTVIQPIGAQDWQNAMCEMDKYWRTANGEGRPKAYYRPNPDFKAPIPGRARNSTTRAT